MPSLTMARSAEKGLQRSPIGQFRSGLTRGRGFDSFFSSYASKWGPKGLPQMVAKAAQQAAAKGLPNAPK